MIIESMHIKYTEPLQTSIMLLNKITSIII